MLKQESKQAVKQFFDSVNTEFNTFSHQGLSPVFL